MFGYSFYACKWLYFQLQKKIHLTFTIPGITPGIFGKFLGIIGKEFPERITGNFKA